MSKSVFTKNRIKGFFVFLIIAAIVTLAASAGLFFYFGHAVNGKTPGGDLKSKLIYGKTFSSDEVIEEQKYKFDWIKSDGVNVEVFVKGERDEDVLTDEVLEYSPENRTFKVVGVAKGSIKFSNAFDKTISFVVPFETSFASPDTASVLTENYPDKFVNGVFSRSAIESVGIISLVDKTTVDLSDLKNLPGVTRLNIKNSDDSLIEFTNFSLPESTRIYVPESTYVAYVSREDETWRSYSDKIFVSVENVLNHSVVLYKNGGVFADDNGKDFDSLEVSDGATVDFPKDYAMQKLGYTFEGWFFGDGKTFDSENLVDETYGFTSDLKLYAKWRANEYTVTVLKNDGSDEKFDLTFSYDSENEFYPEDKEHFSYEGFCQIGWAYSADATVVDFSVDATVKNLTAEDASTVTVYAIWVYENFTVQFYSSADNTLNSPINYKYGQEVILSLKGGTQPTSERGAFVGWTLHKDGQKVEYEYGDIIAPGEVTPFITSKHDGVLRIYPVFAPGTYELYYDANGGTTTPEHSGAISRNASVLLSNPIERPGYKFKGWLDNVGHLWTSEELYQADKKWYDDTYPNDVSRLEKKTNGFEAKHGIETVASTTKVVLRAIWKANTFKVKFYGDGGTYYDDATVTYGRDFYFSGEMSKKGYSMKSCVFNRNYKSAGDSLEIIRTYESFLPDYPTVSLTGRALYVSDIENIYAYLKKGSDNDFNENSVAYFEVTWTANVYKVDFNYNGGTGSVAFKYVYYNGKYGDLPVPSHANEKSGKGHYEFYFNGWSYGGQKVTSSTVAQVAGDHTLVANWTKSNWKKDSCVATGTLVTLADGTYKKVEDLDGSETLLAWDFEKGKIVEAKISLVRSHGVSEYTTATLAFADGTKVKIIGGHGFFDIDLGKFVYLDESNYEAYIGHRFVKDGVTSVSELTSVTVKDEEIGSYSVWTAGSFTCFVNGMLSIGPSGDLFGFGYLKLDGLKFDEAALRKDIETYGLYTYDEWKDYMTAEQFEAFNVAYFKIAVGKGVITENGMKQLIAKLYQ